MTLNLISQPEGGSRSRSARLYVAVTDAIASISKSASRGMRDTSTNVLVEDFITTPQQWLDGRCTHLVGL
jgi:hypothetical protein